MNTFYETSMNTPYKTATAPVTKAIFKVLTKLTETEQFDLCINHWVCPLCAGTLCKWEGKTLKCHSCSSMFTRKG